MGTLECAPRRTNSLTVGIDELETWRNRFADSIPMPSACGACTRGSAGDLDNSRRNVPDHGLSRIRTDACESILLSNLGDSRKSSAPQVVGFCWVPAGLLPWTSSALSVRRSTLHPVSHASQPLLALVWLPAGGPSTDETTPIGGLATNEPTRMCSMFREPRCCECTICTARARGAVLPSAHRGATTDRIEALS